MFRNITRSISRFGLGAVLLGALTVSAVTVSAQQVATSASVYAVTLDNQLITFAANAPGTITNQVPITAIAEGASIVGIDIRPANNQLIGLGSNSRLYILNPTTGAATAIGSTLVPALSGTNFGFDFNPTVDRIRLTSDSTQDLRLNPNNGTVAATDGALAYRSNDPNAGATPNIVASAYTNNFGTSTTTVLYNIDSNLDIFTVQNPPNNGTQVTVGALGVNVGANTSMDIQSDRLGSDNAFVAADSSFYTLNIATGGMSFVGTIGGGISVRAIAVTGSGSAMAAVPTCSDFSGSTNPIVRASFSGVPAFCRVLYENNNPAFPTAAAQLGVQSLLNAGVIQAVDVFTGNASTDLGGVGQVCLQGNGTLIFLSATQSPRTPAILTSTAADGYTCGFITNTGTVVLTR